MINVGVDLHKTQITVCFLADDGKGVTKMYDTRPAGYASFISDLQALQVPREEIRIGVETTGNVWYFVKQVENHAGAVQVVNTMKFKVIVQSTSKTDRRDARTIAEYLKKNMLPTVTLPDAESRMLAKYVKTRDNYVKLATRLKNQIHALYMEEGLELPAQDLTSEKRLRALEQKRELCPGTQFLLEGLITDLLSLKARIKILEKQIEDMGKNDKDINLLRTIPGTGVVSASAVRSILGTIKRFDDPKKVASYAGLAPWVNDSNESIKHGHITKRGSTILRNAFVQMAMGIIRHGAAKEDEMPMPLYAWYCRIKRRVGGGKSKIALARKMSLIVWVMLTTRKPFLCIFEKSLCQAG